MLSVVGVLSLAWASDPGRTAMDGVYTTEQVESVRATYASQCASCHGAELGGSGNAPPLAGLGFLFFWQDRDLGALFTYTKENMPQGSPGTLTDAQYAALTALMLEANGFPAGDEALPADVDVLEGIHIGEVAEP
jgi:S-disulfanyl-L-cysteine oxidoreductase SoxD